MGMMRGILAMLRSIPCSVSVSFGMVCLLTYETGKNAVSYVSRLNLETVKLVRTCARNCWCTYEELWRRPVGTLANEQDGEPVSVRGARLFLQMD